MASSRSLARPDELDLAVSDPGADHRGCASQVDADSELPLGVLLPAGLVADGVADDLGERVALAL
jgi:hypothetical protein